MEQQHVKIARKSTLVDINEIVEAYLPMSKKKARKFVSMYLVPRWIGGRMYVNRTELEALLSDTSKGRFPLKVKSEEV